ncbi:unnamed protein product [Arabidopsis halleri]
MTTKSDLPGDLVEEEILSRVPFTSLRSVRSTCRKWNALSKNRIFGKAAARNQFLGFMMMNYKVCSIQFDLQGIRNRVDFVNNPSVKQVSILDHIEVSQVLHCDGLLLCVIKNNTGLLVWNPYLGQTRWIQPRQCFDMFDRYAIGYDNNRNHKILRIFGEHQTVLGYEIYDFSSSSWKVSYVTPDWSIRFYQRGVSLKGNTYFVGQTVNENMEADILLCFDFTTERFVPPLPLPYPCDDETVSLSCVRDEQLAVLYLRWEVWVTNKIDPYAVSWTKFLRHHLGFSVHIYDGSFFIDEEENVAVVFDLDDFKGDRRRYQTAHILGQDRYLKSVNIGEAQDLDKPYEPGSPTLRRLFRPLVSSSYVPSLVQLQINQPDKEKESDHY